MDMLAETTLRSLRIATLGASSSGVDIVVVVVELGVPFVGVIGEHPAG